MEVFFSVKMLLSFSASIYKLNLRIAFLYFIFAVQCLNKGCMYFCMSSFLNYKRRLDSGKCFKFIEGVRLLELSICSIE
jgi:hypothetical protein